MCTYDYVDGERVQYIDKEADPDDPYEIDGILVDHVNMESRDHPGFKELLDELTKLQ